MLLLSLLCIEWMFECLMSPGVVGSRLVRVIGWMDDWLEREFLKTFVFLFPALAVVNKMCLPCCDFFPDFGALS